jgi:DNA polymerase-1
MNVGGYEYDAAVVGDFEFRALPGSQPKPVCFVGRELVSGRVHRLWLENTEARPAPPFSTGKNTLFVAFYNSAEFGCFNSLRWPMPERAVDLFAEFRCLTNGTRVPCGNGLLGALAYFGEDAMSAAEKKSMRDLILRGHRHYSPPVPDGRSD